MFVRYFLKIRLVASDKFHLHWDYVIGNFITHTEFYKKKKYRQINANRTENISNTYTVIVHSSTLSLHPPNNCITIHKTQKKHNQTESKFHCIYLYTLIGVFSKCVYIRSSPNRSTCKNWFRWNRSTTQQLHQHNVILLQFQPTNKPILYMPWIQPDRGLRAFCVWQICTGECIFGRILLSRNCGFPYRFGPSKSNLNFSAKQLRHFEYRHHPHPPIEKAGVMFVYRNNIHIEFYDCLFWSVRCGMWMRVLVGLLCTHKIAL